MANVTTGLSFRALWDLGYRRLVPIIPPLAPIHPNSRIKEPGKSPGKKGPDGLWFGFSAWQVHDATEDDIARWDGWGAGAGIKCGAGVYFFDADTLSDAWARRVHEIAARYMPDAPYRVGRYPKFGLLFRCDDDLTYDRVRFDDGTGGAAAVELLVNGKQFVAAGTHPATGKPYAWHSGPGRRDDLPRLTGARVEALFAELAETLPGAHRTKAKPASDRALQAPEQLRGDPDKVAAAMRALPNRPEDYDYEGFCRIGYALRGALPDDPGLAFQLFDEWFSRYEGDGYSPEAADKFWASFGKVPPHLGAGYLFSQADHLSGGRFRLADAFFDTLTDDDIRALDAAEDIWAAAAAKDADPAAEDLPVRPVGPGLLSRALPPREWLYGYKIVRRNTCLVGSPGGVGKTAWSTGVALSLLTGEALLGDLPHRKCRVGYYNLEDASAETERRFQAAARFYEIDPSALDRLFVLSGREYPLTILKASAKGELQVHADYGRLRRWISAAQLDVCFLDPALRAHQAPENSNEAMDEFIRLLNQLAEDTGCAFVLVHHTRKGSVSGDADGMRGGSALVGGVRSAYMLAAMSTEEAAKYKIPEEQRRQYVRVDDAKTNMAPSTGRAEWVRLESVSLGNGTPDYPQGDRIQVAVPWKPAGALDGLRPEDADAILAEIDRGPGDGERYTARAQDGKRSGVTMLEERFGRTRYQAVELLSGWLKQGLVEVREYRSPVSRKQLKGLFVNAVVAADTAGAAGAAEAAEAAVTEGRGEGAAGGGSVFD